MKTKTTAFLSLIAFSLCANATVSMQWEFEALRSSSGTPIVSDMAYILVADSGGNGVLPGASDVTGLTLSAGNTFGDGTIFFTGTTTGSVASGSLVSLNMSSYGVEAGDIWSIYWFPGLAVDNTVFAGQSFGRFQSSVLDPLTINYGADTAMVFPADGTPLVTTQFYDTETEDTSAPSPAQFSATQTAAAVPFYWDTDLATAGTQGGTGAWNGTSTHWRLGSSNVAWQATGTDNDAIFGGTAGTVTITSAVAANDLTFNTTGYIVEGGTLTLNGSTPTITTGTGVTATIFSQILGSAGLVKAGEGTLILGGSSSYTDPTQVNTGKLSVNGSLTGSAVQVAADARLGGTGVISGAATTIASGGIHAPGNSVGIQTVADITYAGGSIFEWELASVVGETTTGTRGTDYDGVNVTDSLATNGGGGIFRVVLSGSEDFSNAFWNQNREWPDIIKTANDGATVTYQSIFSSFQVYNYDGLDGSLNSLGDVSSLGSFSIDGSTLKWSAIPEPSSLLVGLLLAAGLLGRGR